MSGQRAPPPRILVGELDEARHDAAPAFDGVDRQATGQHLSPASIDHRDEDGLIGSQQRNVIKTQNLRNEAGWILSHPGGRPKGAQLVTPSPLSNELPAHTLSEWPCAPKNSVTMTYCYRHRGRGTRWPIAG